MEWTWLFILCMIHGNSVGAGSPLSLLSSLEESGRESAIEEELVQFTCTANYTALLLWYVEPSNIPQNDPLAFTPSSPHGMGSEPLKRGEFTAMLTESIVTSDDGLYGNLTSILQVTATLQLNGSIVYCSSQGLAGRNTESKVLRIAVDCGIPEAPINGTIKEISSTVEGSVVVYGCLDGLIPDDIHITVCSKSGSWIPYPMNTHCREPDMFDKACQMSNRSLQQVLGVSLPLTIILTAAVSAVVGAAAGGGCAHYLARKRNIRTEPSGSPLREISHTGPGPLQYEYVSNRSYIHPTEVSNAQLAADNYDDVLPAAKPDSVALQQNIAYSKVLSS